MIRQKTTHLPKPDYSRPPFELTPDQREGMLRRLTFLYGEEAARAYLPELERVLAVYHAHKPPEALEDDARFDPAERFTQEDVILITYGDLLRGEEPSPLATLARFCDAYLEGTINTLHILPFFPYSSDRGFAVIDFEQVDPDLGSWDDIHALESRYNLMFDGVINHVSSQGRWFQEFLNGNPYYKDFFIAFDSPDELSPQERALIFRPRTSDVLVRFDTIQGPAYVWATFSEDQLDLNFKNPNVLMRVVEVLLLYIRRGADIIRLDAVTYLWSERGTQCIHLPQTHEIVKLLRDVLDAVAPEVALITETNVPHAENISYFGDGTDEAQMVYNFALPPLVLHAFYRRDATTLARWASGLVTPSDTTTFFNFLDSHDGIGVLGAQGILSRDEIRFIVERAREHGALISYKTTRDGTEEPYELNTTWFSALNREDAGEDLAFQVKRFVASRAVALVLPGVPGIYLHALMGTENDVEAVLATDSKRDINRSVIDFGAMERELGDPLSRIARMSRELGRLIALRARKRAFHPNGAQTILDLSPRVFSTLRLSPEGDAFLLALINVTEEVCRLEIPLEALEVGGQRIEETHWYDVVGGMEWLVDDSRLHVTLNPYDVVWLEKFDEARSPDAEGGPAGPRGG